MLNSHVGDCVTTWIQFTHTFFGNAQKYNPSGGMFTQLSVMSWDM